MRPLLPLMMLLPGAPAFAHADHAIEVAGNGHWIGLAVIGLAAAIALWSGKSEKDSEDDADGDDASNERQPA